MKSGIAICLASACLAMPAMAQDATPLIRVYMDAPYFYEIMGTPLGGSEVQLMVEGKEVGSSIITYDCDSGEYGETVEQDWTGGAELYIPAALLAYRQLYC